MLRLVHGEMHMAYAHTRDIPISLRQLVLAHVEVALDHFYGKWFVEVVH